MNYFQASEMVQHAGYGLVETAYPEAWITDPTRWPALVKALNRIRQAVNAPVRVLPGGGYRSVEYNNAMYAALGEKPTQSQHSEGRAADITTDAMNVTALHQLILRLYQAGEIEIGGLGFYPNKGFCHVDVRVGWTHLAQWTL